jgi:cell wall-associated NlpC family hydrolase
MYPGDKSEDILKMQQRLKDLGYFNAEPTGYYGDATVAAVMAFQTNNGLSADGKAGKQTRTALYSDSAVPAAAAPPEDHTANNGGETTTVPQPEESGNTEQQQPEEQQPQPPAEATPVPEAPAEPTPDPQPEPEPDPAPAPSESTGSSVLDLANAQIGKPYVYGSNGPNSFDCSGFVYYVLKNSGYSISRYSSATYAYLPQWTTISDVESLAAGDLVFFKSDNSENISHMGIYLGGGSFIHAAPSSGGVAISGMTSGYYQRNYVTAKRI